MDRDDVPIGRILSRREVLALLGFAGVAVLVDCAPSGSSSGASPTQNAAGAGAVASSSAVASVPSCVVRPALTEGPYFVDEKLNRSDIRADASGGAPKEGAPFLLTMNVSRVSGSACTPLSGATVDLWHCDALGAYSDASDPGFNTKGQKWLRGYQVTDANGKVQFTTIYPGWYQGRAVHIHFKIRQQTASGQVSDFTSQFFFDDAMNDQVYAQAPYSRKGTSGILRNASDGIYRGGGNKLLLNVTKSGSGYAATFDIGLTS